MRDYYCRKCDEYLGTVNDVLEDGTVLQCGFVCQCGQGVRSTFTSRAWATIGPTENWCAPLRGAE